MTKPATPRKKKYAPRPNSKRTGGQPAKGYAKNTLTMPPAAWKKLDAVRGKTPRGEFIAGLLGHARSI